MTLEIFVEQNQMTLKLVKNSRTIDSESFSYYHDLSDVLITSLDKLLKRNNIDPVKSPVKSSLKEFHRGAAKRQFDGVDPVKSSKAGAKQFDGVDTTALKSFKIRGNTGKNSTSYKIAAAFIEGLRAGD